MMQPVGDRHFRGFILDNPLRRLFSPPRKMVSKYVSRGKVVADIGCGPGYFALSMAEAVGPEGRVYAVDSDPSSVEVVRSKAAKQGYASVMETHVSSAADLGFIPDGSVDFVFANGLICCMVDHTGATKEIKRIMKRPSGVAYLSVSRMGRKSDPRTVGRQEWNRLVEGFRVVKRGEGMTNRWVVISVKEAEGPQVTLPPAS